MRRVHMKSEMELRIYKEKHTNEKKCNCRKCQHERYDKHLKEVETKVDRF